MRVATPIRSLFASSLLVVGWIALAAAYAGIVTTSSAARAGSAYMLASYDQWLALVGLGIGAAPLPRWSRGLAIAGLLAGVIAGHFAESWAALFVLSPATSTGTYLPLIGPGACVLVGVQLAVPAPIRRWLVGLVGLAVGGALGMLEALHSPGTPEFTSAAAFTAALFVLSALWARSLTGQARFAAVGSRILGSWLIAIGVLLVGTELLAKPRLAASVTTLAPPVIDQGPAVKDSEQDLDAKFDTLIPDVSRQP